MYKGSGPANLHREVMRSGNMSFGWDDCPADIRAQVLTLAEVLRDRLEGSLVGVYLHGSLALGCCNPRQSDLDVLALTTHPVPPDRRAELFRLLKERSRAPLPLEISILVQRDLEPWSHPAPYDLHYSELYRGRIEAGEVPGPGRDIDLAAHLTVTRRHGITIVGSSASQALPPVPWADYAHSILADFDECVRQLTQTYAVLSMARVWATLATGQVHSKESGARWALERMPPELRVILARALASYRQGDRCEFAADPDLAAFKRYLVTAVSEHIPDHPGAGAP